LPRILRATYIWTLCPGGTFVSEVPLMSRIGVWILSALKRGLWST